MGLDVVELMMEVEDVFDIQIPDDDYPQFETVGDLSDYLAQRLPNSTPELVWRTLRGIVSEQLLIPRDQIHRSSRWVEDLKCD